MMAGSSLRRVNMDDYNTEVRPFNQLDKASHIERGPLIWAHNMGPYPHCYSLFHSGAPTATHCFTAGLPHFRMSKLNHSF